MPRTSLANVHITVLELGVPVEKLGDASGTVKLVQG
jgi:hypothetical protein